MQSVPSTPATRVVVTGTGMVGPLGSGVETAWARLCEGRSGIRRLSDDIVPDVPSKIAGAVPSIEEDPVAGFDPDVAVSAKDRKKMDRFIQFALAATGEALDQADWHPEDEPARERVATVIGSGIGGYHTFAGAIRTTDSVGVRRLSPFVVPSFLVNLAAGWVSIAHGFRGPIGAPVTACAASVQAIGDGTRLLRSGEADVALCGGAEGCIGRMAMGGFAAARALSTGRNDEPGLASRPFDRDRDGFVHAEGSGMLVLETLEHARARGAVPLAEVLGYGTSSDAYHVTGAAPDGAGAARAMRIALAQARLEPANIDHVNAHATSTPIGDRAELEALASVFGRDRGPVITATKSATGHMLGAAGAVASTFALLAMRDGLIPPTLNLERPDEAADGFDIVAHEARETPVDIAMVNGFGFGGVNASLVFGPAP